MCDWPVCDSYGRVSRLCDHAGLHRIGALTICARHLSTLVDGVTEAMRREAHEVIREGRATPVGIEEHMRVALAEIARKRRMAKAARDGQEPSCVYFAERQGYIKIGTTTDLAKRIQALATGGNMLEGMTAGPVTLLATILGGPEEELALHRRFWHLRVDPKREWFRFEGILRRYITGLTQPDPVHRGRAAPAPGERAGKPRP